MSSSDIYHVQQLYGHGVQSISVGMKHNGSPDKTFTETRDKITQWIKDRDYTLGRRQRDGVVWALDGERGPFRFTAYQAIDHPEAVVVETGGNFAPYQRDVLALTKAQLKDLVLTLNQRLLVIGAVFHFGENLAHVHLEYEIYTETMTREKFWYAVTTLSRAMDCAKWTMDEKLPDPPSS